METTSTSSRTLFISLIIAAHILLVLVIRKYDEIAILHMYLTLIITLYYALSKLNTAKFNYALAYIVGCEVYWRMMDISLFWEIGKYATGFCILIALARRGRNLRLSAMPIAYFALLLPSIAVMPSFSRDAISFNLSGPFLLAISSLYFGSINLNRQQLIRLLISLMAPIVMIVFTVSFAMATNPDISFTTESSKAASGGYGPNQVSTILGLGFIAAIQLLLITKESRAGFWIITGGISVWLLAQSVLTFSRGGVATAIAALSSGMVFPFRKNRVRVTGMLLVIILGLLGIFYIYPFFVDYTLGAVALRYSETSMTGRDLIMKADVEAFNENFFLGLGPGQSKEFHARYFQVSAAHTELTRLLAEHGVLGLTSFLLLVAMAIRSIVRSTTTLEKSIKAMFLAWAFLTMFHSAMRLAAPGFIFGLCAAQISFLRTPRQLPAGIINQRKKWIPHTINENTS